MDNQEQFFPISIIPKIYAYTIPSYQDQPWTGKRKGSTLLKVGYTEETNAEKRVANSVQGIKLADVKDKLYEILMVESAITKDGRHFKDHEVHKRLVKKGYTRLDGEWFECTVDEVKEVIEEIKNNLTSREKRNLDFKLRPEQNAAVQRTMGYFNSQTDGKPPHFLWNAKMRFGKCFTSLQLAKKMGWKNILVLTYKPAVEPEWKKTLEQHRDFIGWQFVSRDSDFTLENVSKKSPVVMFASFQDILGRKSNGEVKDRFKPAKNIEWDCTILDEYHFGAWNPHSKEFYDHEDQPAEDIALDADEYDDHGFTEESFPLKVNHFLYLSGTPFRAVATGEFLEDQIYNWSYAEEQAAKESWTGTPEDNPYAALPKMVFMTYKMPESVLNVAKQGEFDEFDLNEFFIAEKIGKGDAAEYRFKHENEVLLWFHILWGQQQAFDRAALEREASRTEPVLPFADINLLHTLRHMLWFLPDVASCNAMARLLEKDPLFSGAGYKPIVIAGEKGGVGSKALDYLNKFIGSDPFQTKTITLSCGKLTTGVTIPPWTGVFMLRNCSSPEAYFQTVFRTQSPWTSKELDTEKGGEKEVILKDICYVFDFAPNRALANLADYCSKLVGKDTNGGKNAPSTVEQAVADLTKYLPVLCFDGGNMEELNANSILDYVATGMTSSALARRWQSTRLIDLGNSVLERLAVSQDVIDSLETIEAFRNLNSRLGKVLTSEKYINDLKRKQQPLTDSEKQKVKKESDDNNKFRKEMKEKLLKFVSRIPAFMYLTDYREETLRDVIERYEPELFELATGLTIGDFKKLCDIGVFSESAMNAAIFQFRRFERDSLRYAHIGEQSPAIKEMVGGFESKVSSEEADRISAGVDEMKNQYRGMSNSDIILEYQDPEGQWKTPEEVQEFLSAQKQKLVEDNYRKKAFLEGATHQSDKSIREKTIDDIHAINMALERIDEDLYGVCISCNGIIRRRELEEKPSMTYHDKCLEGKE